MELNVASGSTGLFAWKFDLLVLPATPSVLGVCVLPHDSCAGTVLMFSFVVFRFMVLRLCGLLVKIKKNSNRFNY